MAWHMIWYKISPFLISDKWVFAIYRALPDKTGGLNLRLGRGRRYFGWTIAVDGDLLVGGRAVLLGRRVAPKLVTFLVNLAAARVPVPVVHIAKAKCDRRPDHEGDLPFRQRAAAGHVARGGHPYDWESLDPTHRDRDETIGRTTIENLLPTRDCKRKETRGSNDHADVQALFEPGSVCAADDPPRRRRVSRLSRTITKIPCSSALSSVVTRERED